MKQVNNQTIPMFSKLLREVAFACSGLYLVILINNMTHGRSMADFISLYIMDYGRSMADFISLHFMDYGRSVADFISLHFMDYGRSVEDFISLYF